MSRAACRILRHHLRDRWIGDLLAVLCETCGALWFPEPDAPPIGDAPVGGAKSRVVPPHPTASPAHQAAAGG